MYHIRRKLFSQNFLHNRKLVSKLVRSSSIEKNDLVLEIGPGKGIITDALLSQTQYVLAVEIDSYRYSYLKNRFDGVSNLTLYQGDILNFKLPSLPYKVFANIPFSVEGKIVRYLIDANNPPEDTYLVVMKELAYRLSAPYRENWFSLAHKPWFDFSIYHHFKRTDFIPHPSVDSVMFRFKKKNKPLLSWNERGKFQSLLRVGFGNGLPIWQNLKRRYGMNVTGRVLNQLEINKKTRPTELSLERWILIFKNVQHLLHFTK